MALLARFLNKNGIKVHIISSKSSFHGYYGLENDLKNYSITYLPDFLKNKMIAARQSNHRGLLSQLKFIIKRSIGKMFIPDNGIVIVNSYFKAAKKIIRENGIKNVLISSPPHSLQLVGVKLKKSFGDNINLITDYRDSWNLGAYYCFRNPVFNLISRNLEKKVLRSTNYFTFVSQPIGSKAAAVYGSYIANKSHLIMNGYSASDVGKPIEIENDNKISISCFGTMTDSSNSSSNITPLFNFISRHMENYSDKLRFHFYGPKRINNLNIENHPVIKFHQQVDYSTALSLMQGSDYLLIIHSVYHGCDEILTNKFFDYLSARKPIIILGPQNMEAVRITLENHIGLHADYRSEDEMRCVFNSIIENSFTYNSSFNMEPYEINHQFESFLNLVK